MTSKMQQEMSMVVLVVEWFSCSFLCVYVVPDMMKHLLSLWEENLHLRSSNSHTTMVAEEMPQCSMVPIMKAVKRTSESKLDPKVQQEKS